ncbi:MAG: DNA mismatch repair protein MutS [bacterium]|nr:DNA mismatch repair protein MutS [bacterium]
MPLNPREEYEGRLAVRRAVVERYDRLHIRLGNVRLMLTLLAVALAWLGFFQGLVSGWWLLLPLTLFVVSLVVHDQVLRTRSRAVRAVDFYRNGLDRLNDNWAGKGSQGMQFFIEDHPYARDLDLFGKGSLFELVSRARTLSGEHTLARWLAVPAAAGEIRARQQAVEELRSRLDLREDLAVLGEEVRRGVHADSLPRWGEHTPLLESKLARVVAAILAGLTFPLGVWLAATALSAGFQEGVNVPEVFVPLSRVFVVLVTLEAILALFYRRRVQRVVAEVEQPAQELALLSETLRRLEVGEFTCERLVALGRALETEGRPASHQIARLRRLIEMLDSRDNVAVRAIGPLLLWTTQLAFAIEAWRKRTGGSLRRWLEAVGEFEALSSLAGHAYEHPEDPYPEIADEPVYAGLALGHPLLPDARCVRNDVELDASRQVLLVSGSNMSGKSTLLRTIGINAVLAMAGAPVRAKRLRLAPLGVGASIRVTDSLHGGTSRFYAEITRIRQLMDIAGDRTLLFLLDELLHGTNSHDRRIGAEAIVEGLVKRGALGLVTTHDLALAHIADQLAPRAANVHFEDHLKDGQMTFDYVLRPGVVEKSNAIELMRSVGLKV